MKMHLGVDWHLPLAAGGYAKRRFAHTTRASADLIHALAEDGLTWAQVATKILFDSDARKVAEGFIAAGLGATLAEKHLTGAES